MAGVDRYDPMPGVRRVEDETGSHIEPPLDPEWSRIDQLRWHAAAVQVDAGITLSFAHFTEHDTFGIFGHGHSIAAVSFPVAWRTVSDLGTGAEMARKVVAQAIEEVADDFGWDELLRAGDDLEALREVVQSALHDAAAIARGVDPR